MAVFWNRNLALRDKRSSEKRALERDVCVSWYFPYILNAMMSMMAIGKQRKHS